jgi:hypothetical protein
VEPTAKLLFKFDTPRGFFTGILEVGFSIFVLLIAIRFFEAPNYCKGLLAAGSSLGLIFSPLLKHAFSNVKISISAKCSFWMGVCSLFIFLASFTKEILFFTALLVTAQISLAQIPNLMIQLYAQHYSAKERGFRLSLNLVLSTIGGMLSSYCLGKYLDLEFADYRIALWTMAFAALVCCCLHFSMPKLERKSIKTGSRASLKELIKIPLEDRLFLRILIAWMILGFGVIMTFPLRVEFLADRNGLNLTNEEIALVGVAVFFLFKIIGVVICGKLFDRTHFMKFRISLNLIMLIAILIYFNSNTFFGVALGSAIAGIGTGGANIAWNLWVTKLAPTGRESEYMSIHMFLTGIRGSTAPFLGYLLVKPLGFSSVSLISSSFVLVATILFSTTLKDHRFKENKFKDVN